MCLCVCCVCVCVYVCLCVCLHDCCVWVCVCLPSPSGCTFWGKKPWSRKKKILWQLGTLIGAPIGITLIAGIAVPAMVIGIPVYVGRKVSLLPLAGDTRLHLNVSEAL